MSDEHERHHPRYGEVEEYAGGEIRAYHGIVNRWLLARVRWCWRSSASTTCSSTGAGSGPAWA